ncbi:hypothetical protein C8N35_113113, partial [Breoghania corrubedonensis]
MNDYIKTSDFLVDPWEGFSTGAWRGRIDVRGFIQENYTPYEGDAAFLAPASARTIALWAR